MRQFWNITIGIYQYATYHVQIMLLFVYTTTHKRFVIFTCRYFKLSWNTTALRQSNCRYFSCGSITLVIQLQLGDHFDNSRRLRSQFLRHRQRGSLHHRSSLNHNSLQNYRKCSDATWSQSQNRFTFVTFSRLDPEKFWKSNKMLPKPKRGLLLKLHLAHFIFTISILKKGYAKS